MTIVAFSNSFHSVSLVSSDGFVRITSGPDEGGYYHELFLRGRPALCVHMRRVGVPMILPTGEVVSRRDHRRIKKASGVTMDPDFYAMKPITLKPGTNEEEEEKEKEEDKKASSDDEAAETKSNSSTESEALSEK